MSPALSATLRVGEFEARVAALQAGAPQAVVRALNRSIASARTATGREVAQDMGLNVGEVRDRIRIENANVSQLVARLHASPKRVPLMDFKARGPEPSRGKGKGVTARLRQGGSWYPHAFIATMASGHRGVFQRKGGTSVVVHAGKLTKKGRLVGVKRRLEGAVGRLPIYELFGPSIVRVFEKYSAVGARRAVEQLAKNLRSELNYVMRRSAA